MKVKEQQEQEYKEYIDYEEWLRYNNPPPTNNEINHMEKQSKLKEH